MRVTALRSFSGAVSMSRGETREIQDMYIVEDLLQAGYIAAEGNPQTPADTPVPPSDTEDGAAQTEELQEMHFNDLKKLAKDMGLDTKGSKEELIARISAAAEETGDAK